MASAKREEFSGPVSPVLRFVAVCLFAACILAGLLPREAHAQALVINDVGAPSVFGSGQGKRAMWTNAGSVGGTTVDIVAVFETATLDHTPSTQNNRPSITSVGQDDVWVRWYLYAAGTYNLASNSGGVPVVADVHVQFNDVDGPNNERVFVPVCSGDVEWLRIDSGATTGRSFGTVGAHPETFTLIGDQSYNQEPVSGVEIYYPNRSNFLMGRTADNSFYIRLDNPTYSAFTTYDYNCGDFVPPIANDDELEGTPGSPAVIGILLNDANATANDNSSNNDDLLPSEYGKLSVNITPPVGATNVVLDGQGEVASFTVPGEGDWSYNESTGELSFAPLASFKGYAAIPSYTYTNALAVSSNSATVTVWYPAIGAVKSATFNDESGDGYAQVGETISYQYALTAYGSTPLENVSLTETGFSGAGTTPIPTLQSGDVNADSRLDLTETWIYTATYTLVAGDLAAGSVTNLATANAQTPGGKPVTDLSDSTNPADGDGVGTPGPGPNNGDATLTPLGTSPIIANDDSPSPVIGGADSLNIVNVLTNDTLGGATATAISVSISVTSPATPANPGDPVPTLNPIDGNVSVSSGVPGGTYQITYQICEVGNAANCDSADVDIVVESPVAAADDTVVTSIDTAYPQPGVINVLDNDLIGAAQATPAQVAVSAVGTLPTGFTLNADGSVDVAEFTDSGVYTFDYQICALANPANCDTATVTVPVDKSVPAISGTVYFDQDSNNNYDPGSDPQEPGYIVELMLNGAVVKSTISGPDGSYEIRDFAPGSGYMLVFRDSTTGISVGSINNLTFAPDSFFTDRNQPIDPRGVVYSSATGLPIAGVGIRMTTAGGTPLPAACLLPGQQPQVTSADGAYRFDIVAGASIECPASETEYRIEITGSPGHTPAPSVLAPPQPGALDATTCPGDAIPGGDCQLSASSSAPAAGSPTPYYLAFLLQPGDPDVTNNHIPLDLLAAITSTGISVVKTAARPVVERGGLAAYTIVVRNTNLFPVGPADLIDRLPAGFSLAPGSATIAGAPTNPAVNGREVRFAGLTVPALGSLTITLNARVPASATPGEYVNQATLIDPATGNALAPAGTATVRIDVDHVFDCGDVIGKVFDDRNRNGAQENGERGMPGVRLATVNGILITTDSEGRYNVPCAALPDPSSGSNFILKLDTRTLPTGFHLTTENPRVVRLTRGKATKLNFGVATAQTVSVDLVGKAFHAGSDRPLAAVDPVVAQIVGQLAERQGALRLTYHVNGDAHLAQDRLRGFESLIRAHWKRIGRSALSVERRIVEGN